jgi:hypothetical protein
MLLNRRSGLKALRQVIDNQRNGERGRNRTYNLLIKSQLLCQLSYAPFNDLGDCWRDFARSLFSAPSLYLAQLRFAFRQQHKKHCESKVPHALESPRML